MTKLFLPALRGKLRNLSKFSRFDDHLPARKGKGNNGDCLAIDCFLSSHTLGIPGSRSG